LPHEGAAAILVLVLAHGDRKAQLTPGVLAAVVSLSLVAAVILSACDGSGGAAGVDVTLVTPEASPTTASTVVVAPTVVESSPAPTVESDGAAEPSPVPQVHGLIYPIAGACLPSNDDLMPNAPRSYRAGIHEGVDFYGADNCLSIPQGTEVLAAEGGEVIRADTEYKELTAEELEQLNQRIAQEGSSAPAVLDRFRGRQVWIDHGGGLVTRYAHLDGIAPGIEDGVYVQAGDVIGYVGESGTPESVTAPGTEYHLHFEIRVGHTYLGQGLPPAEVRALYEQAFSP
jgi:murein DD-endopeptidase MepM/ murein hydrolase activator NlpD